MIASPAVAIGRTLPMLDPPVSSPAERDYLSFSAIRTYQACPLRYYFRYVLGLPEPTTSASLVFGAALHRALERHYRDLLAGEPPATLDQLLEEYQQGWAGRGLEAIQFASGETRQSLAKLAEKMLGAFLTSPASQPAGQILGIEETLRGKIIETLPDLLGRVDLISETPAELVITDWKTSRSRWSPAQVEEAAEQLLLYAALAQDFSPGKPVRLEFIVLTKTKETTIDRHSLLAQPPQIARLKQIIHRVWQAIQAPHFYPAPSQLNCSHCPFREPCRNWSG